MPARGFAVGVSLNQVFQDTLGAALVVVVDRGELLGRETGVETEFLPDLRKKRPLMIVAGLGTRQDPALSLGVGKLETIRSRDSQSLAIDIDMAQ